MRGDRERCLAAGMDDYLSKPLRTPMLLDALDRWVSPAERASEPAGAADEPAPSHAEEHPPLLDRSVIADLRDLDGEVLSELIILYFDGAATQLAELESAVARGEAAELARAAHKLKGSSATLGAARVSQLAGELESRARGGEAGDAEQLVRRLAGAIEESRDAFHQMPA
jgi:HPt (histidine-containing phosphotransfer) domain-containing protein